MNFLAKQRSDFHRRLHRWYKQHGRKDLPWRNTDDAYAIYVSEIMLQQTQVKTVLERYYFPFLKRFPTLTSLANARQQDVLKAWQGLGYYNRAIHLHNAAIVILSTAKDLKKDSSPSAQNDKNITLPKTVEALMALPGVGRNTAHAVAAFAYRKPAAVMEANVKRVVARIFALKQPNETELWEAAELLLDQKEPFDYNQAMMDIGATVCTRRAPRCTECPAQMICLGKASPESYPAAKIKKPVPVRRKNIFVLCNAEEKYFAQPRQSRFLNGLYHFVEEDNPPPLEGGGKGVGQRKNAPLPNPPPQGGREYIALGEVRQQYSHFTLDAEVYLVEAKGSGKGWHTLAQLKKLPFSMAEQKILSLLAERHAA